MSARAVAIAARAEPPRDAWDRLLIVAIFGGMLALAYAAFATSLLQPLFSLAERGEWSELWIRPTVIWMKMGIIHEEAAATARAAGLTVVMDRCPKVEIPRLQVQGITA